MRDRDWMTAASRLGAAWAALELIARGCEGEAEHTLLRELMASPGINLGELLEQAMRHKLLPRLSLSLEEAGVLGQMPAGIRYELRSALGANRHRIAVLRDAVVSLSSALSQAGVRFACTKGIVLESTIYGGTGARVMLDLDFMITPASAEATRRVMQDLNFQVGRWDWRRGSVTPLPRQSQLMYAMSRDHLPHFIKPSQDPIIPFISVDFATSFTWEHSRWQLPIEDCFEHLTLQQVPDHDHAIPVFAPSYHFLFIILHLFREGWHERAIRTNDDVNLAKFGDVNGYYRTFGKSLSGFGALAQRYEVVQPVSWVLTHLDLLWNTSVCASVGLPSADRAWLATASGSAGDLRWKSSMRERLQSRNRASILEPLPHSDHP